MNQLFSRYKAVAVMALTAWLIWPAIGAADVSGQAAAIKSTVMGTTTVVADTGALSGPNDARFASFTTGSIPSLGGVEVPNAMTLASGVETQSVDSMASVGNLSLGIPGNVISADLVMAQASTAASGASSGSSLIDGLSINGLAVDATGAANQVIYLVGGRVVINEQQTRAGGIAVNALHVIVDGLADVVVGSASSGVVSSVPLPSPLPLPPLF